MEKSAVLDFLREVIPEMKDIESEDIQPGTTIEELEFDSLDFVEIQLALRKSFSIELQQDSFIDGAINTVDDLCAYVVTQGDRSKQILAAGV